MTSIKALSAALTLALAPTLAGATAGPTPPQPGDLPPGVSTGYGGESNVSGAMVLDGGNILITREDGGASILDGAGNLIMDCDERLKDCLDLANGETEGDPEGDPEGEPEGGPNAPKGGVFKIFKKKK